MSKAVTACHDMSQRENGDVMLLSNFFVKHCGLSQSFTIKVAFYDLFLRI